MPKELAVTLAAEIKSKHLAGISADHELREALLKKLELTRQCGLLLDEARDQFHNGKWQEFCDGLPFDGQAVRQYLRFARRHPDPITDIKTAMRSVFEAALATGLLEFPDGHGQQHLHEPNFLSKLTIAIQQLASDWRKFVHRRPLDRMSEETREQILCSLRPLDRIRAEILRSLKRWEVTVKSRATGK